MSRPLSALRHKVSAFAILGGCLGGLCWSGFLTEGVLAQGKPVVAKPKAVASPHQAVPEFDFSDMQMLPMGDKEPVGPSSGSVEKPSIPLAPASVKPAFKASAQKSTYLPPEMYGDWSVTATLLDANALGMFSPVVHEIWRLEEGSGAVTLSNPNTGASATVSVDKVEGNKASFHRVQYGEDMRQRVAESPTLVVMKNRLDGITVNQMDFLKNGKVVRSYVGRYQIQAERIAMPRVKFGRSNAFTAPPEFEIEAVRKETTPMHFPWMSTKP